MARSVFEDREGSDKADENAPNEPTNVVALPLAQRASESTPKPTPKPKPARPAPCLISRKSVDELAKVLGALHGCSAMGVASISDPSKCDLLHGAGVVWEGLGTYCATTIETISKVEPAQSNEPISSHLSTRGHQILVQSFPRSDICIFMVAATERMNSSIARMAFTRLCRAYEISAQ